MILGSPGKNLKTVDKFRIPPNLVKALLLAGEGAEKNLTPESVLEPRPARQVVVPTHSQQPPPEAWLNRVKKGKRHHQVMLTMQARHPQGDPMILKVLIDSGAEANLVRYDLFPKSTLKPSPSPLTLVTANGELMGGGRKEITLTLQLLYSTPDKESRYPGPQVALFTTPI